MAKNVFGGARVLLLCVIFGVSPLAATEQVDKLTALDPAQSAQFGNAVAISGSTLLIGAHQDEETANNGDDYGAAYIFERDSGGAETWTEVKKLLPSIQVQRANFGYAVALDGDTAVVGAYRENGEIGGVQGAVYVYERNEGGTDQWGEVQRIVPFSTETGDQVGCSVAVEGSRMLIGACQDDDAGPGAGSAYVFERDGKGVWNLVVKLIGDDTVGADHFGSATALSGNVAIIGAPQHAHPSSISGAAYIFELFEGEWIQVTKARALGDPGGFFGHSLDVDGTTAVFGAYLNNPGGSPGRGAAYIFERNPDGLAGWLQVAKLVPSNATSSDNVGRSVAIEGSTAVVGAINSPSGAHNGGSTHIYQRDRGGLDNWGRVIELLPDDIENGDAFGSAAAIEGGYALISAIDGDDTFTGSGAAYVFRVDPPTSPFLSVPVGIPGVVDEPVTVPVTLHTDTAALTGVTFSIDYDSTCLSFDATDADFDGIPEAVTILVPAPFAPSVAFDLGDANGELEITLVDVGNTDNLVDGPLVELVFTPICSPMDPQTISAPVNFAADSGVLFRDQLGQDYGGHREGGSVEIYGGMRGDCNADGALTANDLAAGSSELFDGDEPFWLEVPGGTFGGSAVGCDSNGDTVVDAGDLACKAQLLGAGTCSQADPGISDAPRLSLPSSLAVNNGSVLVEVELDPGGHAIVGSAFSLDSDPTRLSFDPTDANLDGIPDAIEILDPAITHRSFVFDAMSTEGELGIFVGDLSAAPTPLGNGPLLRIRFEVLVGDSTLESAVGFGTAPAVSFGDAEGRSISGTAGFDLRPFFEDGFESGNVSAWSSSVGE